MVKPVDAQQLARLPMAGGSLDVRFENRDDLSRQQKEFLPNMGLFVDTDAQPPPFCEFQLTLHLPGGAACEPIPARLVQIVSGASPGLMIQILNLPEAVKQQIQPNVEKPSKGTPDKLKSGMPRPRDDAKPKKKGRMNLHEEIRQMNPNERCRLAAKADRLTRSILMRDNESRVLLFLLKNPHLSRQEAIDISRLPSHNFQTVNAMLANSNWSQIEELRYNLVMNPKTPVQIALRLVPNLSMKHIREIAKDFKTKTPIKQAALRIVLKAAN